MMSSRNVQADQRSHRLMELINGVQTTQAIYVAVTLGVPDLLRHGPLPYSRLAALTGSHPGALYRLLRALAAIGIYMRAKTSNSRSCPSARVWPAASKARATLGRNSSGEHRCGWPGATCCTACEPARRAFAMRTARMCGIFAPITQKRLPCLISRCARVPDIAGEMLSAHDFTQFGHIVDVGGGNGGLIAGLLAGCQHATGTLLDLEHVVAGAGEVLEQAGVSQRCKVVAGSFFDNVPAGGDVYVLKSILHDWDDRAAQRILRNCRRAMGPGAKLLVVERVLAPPNEGAEGKLSDLNMLVNAGGCERTRGEFGKLLASAGLTLDSASPLPSSRFVIEATLTRS